MAISTTSSVTNVSSAATITMQDFLKVLLTQLTYQDPLKPLDNQQFMAQIAQFTTLQQTQELNSKIGHLLDNQAAMQSVGLLGRTVNVMTPSGSVTGTVTGLSWAGNAPQLTIGVAGGNSLNVDLGQIISVR